MSQKPETLFRQRLQKRLTGFLPHIWFESIQQKSIQGTPDIILCAGGIFVALELKATPTSKATVMQRLKLSRIADAGGIGLIVHPENMDNTLLLIEELIKQGKERDAKAKLGKSERSESSVCIAEAGFVRED